jgi:tetratricopeptide (TPR) repeat protein
MRAHHWRSALELARASRTDEPALVERTRLALRDSGDRAAGLNNHAAAASLYEEALDLWPADDFERVNLVFRRARALFRAYDARAEGALEEARDALLGAGDRVRAGEAEGLRAHIAWDRGHGDVVRGRLSRARELVGDAVSPSAARVLSTSGRMLTIANEPEEGRRYAEAALAMAEELRLDEVRAHALATVGMAKNDLDGGSGIEDIERALALALDADSPTASSIVNNLAVQNIIGGDLARADDLYAEALRLAERFGDASGIRFIRGNRIWMAFARGRWSEALSGADAFIAECEAGSPHTQEGIVRHARAQIRLAQGDTEGALEDAAHALALARERHDPVSLVAALSISAALRAEGSALEEARALVDELVPLIHEVGPHGAIVQVAVFADWLRATDELRAALAAGRGPRARRWRDTLDAALSGDLARAADTIREVGFVSTEAWIRLRAGLRLIEENTLDEAAGQLSHARAFYRSVDAIAYVGLIERALADAQRDSA